MKKKRRNFFSLKQEVKFFILASSKNNWFLNDFLRGYKNVLSPFLGGLCNRSIRAPLVLAPDPVRSLKSAWLVKMRAGFSGILYRRSLWLLVNHLFCWLDLELGMEKLVF